MKSRRLPVLASLLVLASAAALHAAPAMDPFSASWQWEQPQRKITAKSIIEHSYYMDFQTKKFPDKPQQNVKINLLDGQVAATIFLAADGTELPETEIKFENGRRTKIIRTVRIGEDGKPPTILTNTETAAYDAKGQLVSITVDRQNQPPATKFDIQTEATPDGGKKLSWSIPMNGRGGPAATGPATASAPADALKVSLTYDKSGNLIGREATFPGRTIPASTWKYNDKNDPVDVATGNTHDIYDYEYDAKGNWTKRTHTQVSHQPDGTDIKNVQDMTTRDITY